MPPARVLKLDACGLQCPGPVLKLKQHMDNLKPGERLEVSATDAGFPRDAEAWCRSTGNRFLSKTSGKGVYQVVVEKQHADQLRPFRRKAIKEKLLFFLAMTLIKL